MSRSKSVFWLSLMAATSSCGDGEDEPASTPVATSPRTTPPGVSPDARGYAGGVVAVSSPLAAQVGAEVLEAGGNAIDAAVAVQFALNVVEPQSSGIGGGGFMLVHLANTGETFYVDGRERAPAGATPDMFGALGFEAASTSGISIGVPGALRAVSLALDNWGTISLAEALAPAIALAEVGITVSASLAADVIDTSDRGFVMTNLQPETAAIFQPGGVPLAEGDTLTQPDLANTFRLISEQGPEVFYTGEIAEAMVLAQTRAGTSDSTGGMLLTGAPGTLTLADLAAYEPTIRQPLQGSYRGYTVQVMPPPSGGGVTVLQQLAMLERFPLGDTAQGFGFGGASTLQVLIEGMRLSFADRNFWVGDADFVNVPTAALLASDYLAGRSALIELDSALGAASIAPGNPLQASVPQTASVDAREGAHTTHYVVIDGEHNIVSFTTTIESLFGSGITVPGYGFLLSNQMTDFSWPPTLNPETGDIGANDVAPGKRPRSSMTPTLLLDGDTPIATIGSAGGSRIINAVVQVISNLVDHDMSVEQAIDAPRISAFASGTVFCETGPFVPTGFMPLPALSNDVVGALNALREPALGMPPCNGNQANGANLSAQAAVIDVASGLAYGAADKRREGTVIGVP
jgi:gamma-glutamyltranspeptidase / glutathione hydrolase